jgi:hypothetical protein
MLKKIIDLNSLVYLRMYNIYLKALIWNTLLRRQANYIRFWKRLGSSLIQYKFMTDNRVGSIWLQLIEWRVLLKVNVKTRYWFNFQGNNAWSVCMPLCTSQISHPPLVNRKSVREKERFKYKNITYSTKY